MGHSPQGEAAGADDPNLLACITSSPRSVPAARWLMFLDSGRQWGGLWRELRYKTDPGSKPALHSLALPPLGELLCSLVLSFLIYKTGTIPQRAVYSRTTYRKCLLTQCLTHVLIKYSLFLSIDGTYIEVRWGRRSRNGKKTFTFS